MSRLAKNSAIDYLRSKDNLKSTKNDDLENCQFEVDKTHYMSFNPDTIGLKKLMQNLPRKQSELMNLVFFEGFTHSEAAIELNVPLGTAKTRLRMGVQTMRKSF